MKYDYVNMWNIVIMLSWNPQLKILDTLNDCSNKKG